MSKHEPNLKILEAKRKLAQASLKMCPVCDALNSTDNKECFACCWHGRFIHDPREIERGLRALLMRCPEFRKATPQIPKDAYTEKVPRWKFLLRRVLKGRLDYKI